jgi:hypothetical protein
VDAGYAQVRTYTRTNDCRHEETDGPDGLGLLSASLPAASWLRQRSLSLSTATATDREAPLKTIKLTPEKL